MGDVFSRGMLRERTVCSWDFRVREWRKKEKERQRKVFYKRGEERGGRGRSEVGSFFVDVEDRNGEEEGKKAKALVFPYNIQVPGSLRMGIDRLRLTALQAIPAPIFLNTADCDSHSARPSQFVAIQKMMSL